ncbi:hypothetical protein pb186bvf_001382 [Paramecium bursaria]
MNYYDRIKTLQNFTSSPKLKIQTFELWSGKYTQEIRRDSSLKNIQDELQRLRRKKIFDKQNIPQRLRAITLKPLKYEDNYGIKSIIKSCDEYLGK